MPDRRQVLRVLLLGTAGLAAPAACGLPSGGRPVADGPGPSAGPGSSGSPVSAPLARDAANQQDLVTRFLNSVAGKLDTDGDLTQAGQRAMDYLTTPYQGTWQPGGQVTVVRVGDKRQSIGDPGQWFVDVDLVPVGTLQTDGTVKPATSVPAPRTLRFTVVPNTEEKRPGAWLIDDIVTTSDGPQLNGMLLDSEGLNNLWYTPQLIYFWSTATGDQRGLVPDLRYVPLVGLSKETQRTEIVNWMLAGPSDFLNGAVVDGVYTGITLQGPNLIPPDNNGLLVNLSGPLPQAPITLQQVMDQLRWSLRGSYSGTVRLQLASQPQPKIDGSGNGYLTSNLADDRRDDETRFCVAAGVVRPVDNPYQLPPAVDDLTLNKNVRLAALSRDRQFAALVKTDNRLYVGGVMPGHDKPSFVQVPGLAGTDWTRPVFLYASPDANPAVLVAVGGRLYQVDHLDGRSTEIDFESTLTDITAFSVAPDGHRIALIAQKTAWVASLRVDASGINPGTLQSIDPGLVEPSAIAWSRLDRVLVAGQSPQAGAYQLSEVTIDGAIAEVWGGAVTSYSSRISSVVALPHRPSDSTETGPVMVTTGNSSFVVGPGSSDPLVFKPAGGSPTPTPTASGAPAGLGTPSNPFFLD